MTRAKWQDGRNLAVSARFGQPVYVIATVPRPYYPLPCYPEACHPAVCAFVSRMKTS